MNDSSLYLAVVRNYDAPTGIARVTVPVLTGKEMVSAWASHGIPAGEGPVPGQTVWVSFWNPEQPVWNSESAVLEGWTRSELALHEARLTALERAGDPPWEPLALVNGWRNYGGGYTGAEMRSLPTTGMVEVRGLIVGGSGHCCTIPWEEKWMPVAMSYHSADMASNAHSYVIVDHDDNEIQPAGSGGYFSLSGTRYSTALATGWIPVTFQNGWTNYNIIGESGKLEQDVAYRKLPNGDVEVRGTAIVGTANVVGFTLPAGYRPPESLLFDGTVNGAHGRIDVGWDGPVIIRGGTTGAWYSINIVFTTLDAELDGSDHPAFTYVTAGEFTNAWVNYGLPWQSARYMRRNDKSVMLDGLIKSGTPVRGRGVRDATQQRPRRRARDLSCRYQLQCARPCGHPVHRHRTACRCDAHGWKRRLLQSERCAMDDLLTVQG